MKKILLLFILFFMGVSNSLAVVEYDEDGNVIEYDLGEDEMRITNVEEIEEEDYDTPTSSNDPVEYIPRNDETNELDKDIMAVTEAETTSVDDEDKDEDEANNTMYFVIGGTVLVASGALIYFKRKNA